jgi:chromosome segregation ATPase
MTLNQFIARATGFFDKSEKQLDTLAQLTESREALATIQTERDTLANDLQAINGQLKSVTEANATLATQLAEAKAAIENPAGTIQRAAGAMATQITASQGIPPVAETANAEGPKTVDQLWEEYHAPPNCFRKARIFQSHQSPPALLNPHPVTQTSHHGKHNCRRKPGPDRRNVDRAS